MTKYLDYDGVKKLWTKVKGYTDSKVSNAELFLIVEQLPQTGLTNKIYLVKDQPDNEEKDVYQEYYFKNGAWEKLGTHQIKVDLSPYAKTETVNSQLSGKVDKQAGKGLSTNDYTTAEKNKLAGIPSNANHTDVDSVLNANSTNPVQNKVVKGALDGKVDNSTYNAKMTALDQKNNSQDTAIAGKADKSALNNVVYNNQDTTFGSSTASVNLDVFGDIHFQKDDGGIFGGKQDANEVFTTDGGTKDISVMVGDVLIGNGNGNLTIEIDHIDGTSSENTIPVASNKAAGAMSAADKSKLDGIPANANHTTVDASLNNTSANPVQNKAVFSALSGKVDNSTYNTDKTSLQGAIDAKLNKTDIVAITDAELEALLV